MSSVPESERQKGKLFALTKALYLTTYTIKITKNPKTFDPTYNNAITADIIHTAKDMYTSAWTANNIRVDGNAEKAHERLNLQVHAIQQCNALFPMIEIAYKIFHLSSKRVRHWARLVAETKESLTSWHESDVKRYRM